MNTVEKIGAAAIILIAGAYLVTIYKAYDNTKIYQELLEKELKITNERFKKEFGSEE